MTRFYRLLRASAGAAFDPVRAAALEVEWWRAHRADQHGAGPDAHEELVGALREVRAGRSVVDSEVVDALVGRRTRLANSPLAQLTARELDVLREMAQGKSNPGIARALHLSESTVEKHVNSIFATLGLTAEPELNRRVAAVLAFLRDSGIVRA
jgi:DNA-binding NarL/FixJ family response regulator